MKLARDAYFLNFSMMLVRDFSLGCFLRSSHDSISESGTLYPRLRERGANWHMSPPVDMKSLIDLMPSAVVTE